MNLASFSTRQGHVRDGHAKGFTLIELLVVIAIIGILAAVVLASLQTARNKGADAAIKSDIDSARAQAELFYNGNGANGYTNVCTANAADGTPGIANMVNGSTQNGSTVYWTVCGYPGGSHALGQWRCLGFAAARLSASLRGQSDQA